MCIRDRPLGLYPKKPDFSSVFIGSAANADVATARKSVNAAIMFEINFIVSHPVMAEF